MVYRILSILACLNNFHQVLSLVALPPAKGNDIIKAEIAIRDTVNGLLESLKTAPEKAPKLEKYLHIQNHFLSLSHKDYINHKEIEKLTRVTDNRNVTTILMNTINDILNENNTEQFKYKPPQFESSHKQIDDFAGDTDRLTAKYRIPHENKTAETGKKINIKDKLNTILGKSENVTLNTSEFWGKYCNCIDSSRRIFGAKKTRITRFPFVIVVQIFGQFYCSGALIHDDLVITAASCLQLAWNNRHFRENWAHVSVRVGSHLSASEGEVIAVIEIYFNPFYNPKTLQSNLAILRLHRHINFEKSKKVRKILYDKNPHQLPFSTDGVTIIGWGATDSSNKLHYNQWMQHSKVGIMPLVDCQEIYTKEFVKQDNICIGYASRGSGACNHDVGAPGVVNNILVGVVSFASPVCGQPNAPTVLVKLGFHAEWIEEIISNPAPYVKTPVTTLKSTPKVASSEETTTQRMTSLKEVKTKPTSEPIHMDGALIKYFNNDSDLYENFVNTCNDKDVKDFARALRGHGLELNVSKRREAQIDVYLK